MNHDGQNVNGVLTQTYYAGQGDWAPIMVRVLKNTNIYIVQRQCVYAAWLLWDVCWAAIVCLHQLAAVICVLIWVQLLACSSWLCAAHELNCCQPS